MYFIVIKGKMPIFNIKEVYESLDFPETIN